MIKYQPKVNFTWTEFVELFTDECSVSADVLFEDDEPCDIVNITYESNLTNQINLHASQLTSATVDRLYSKARRQFETLSQEEDI